jgi:TPR repeat protein
LDDKLKSVEAALQAGDFEHAARNLPPLAIKGDPHAQFLLATLYSKGRGVELDCEKAFVWFSSAANNGHSRAQSALGLLYLEGIGTTVDEVEAVRWMYAAAAQSDMHAVFNLAGIYSDGNAAIKRDVEHAIDLWTEVVHNENSDAALVEMAQ